MLDHLGILATSHERSLPFFEACLAPLGLSVRERRPEIGAAIFTGAEEFPFFFLGTADGAYYGTNLATSGIRPVHLAFRAPSRGAVEEFHRAGMAQGGQDNGAPADCGPGYYAAYLLDPDGNNIEAGFRA